MVNKKDKRYKALLVKENRLELYLLHLKYGVFRVVRPLTPQERREALLECNHQLIDTKMELERLKKPLFKN
jgi:hypothetical protein